MSEITAEQRAEWRRLCGKATAAPWDVSMPEGMDCVWMDVVGPDGDEVCEGETQPRLPIVSVECHADCRKERAEIEANLHLIAASRTALPQLLVALEAAEQRAERAERDTQRLDQLEAARLTARYMEASQPHLGITLKGFSVDCNGPWPTLREAIDAALTASDSAEEAE
jgi:hypothetical protein